MRRRGGNPQSWIARCLEEKAPWVDLKCTLSLWGVSENHLVGRLLSLLEVPLWTEVAVRVDMSFGDTQTHYRGHSDSFLFVVVFSPSSSRNDNISVCQWNWGQELAEGTKCHYIMGFEGAWEALVRGDNLNSSGNERRTHPHLQSCVCQRLEKKRNEKKKAPGESAPHLAASLDGGPRSGGGRLVRGTGLEVRALLREHLTARQWWMSGEPSPPAICCAADNDGRIPSIGAASTGSQPPTLGATGVDACSFGKRKDLWVTDGHGGKKETQVWLVTSESCLFCFCQISNKTKHQYEIKYNFKQFRSNQSID